MSEEDHNDQTPITQDTDIEEGQSKKVKITTSAVVHSSPQVSREEPDTQSDSSSTVEVRQADIPAPWSKSEPLTKIHSILGHMAQGDVYRNKLELIYDRLTGEAEAPEFIPNPEDLSQEPISTHEESADVELEGEGQPLSDPFADDSFEFAMSMGEVSIGGDTPIDQQSTAQLRDTTPMSDANIEDANAHKRIFGHIDLDDFDHLHQTARTSIGLSSQEIEADLRPQELLDDENFTRLSASPEEWEEADIDPLMATRPRQQGSALPFFEVDAESQTSVIQGEGDHPRPADQEEAEEDTLVETKSKK